MRKLTTIILTATAMTLPTARHSVAQNISVGLRGGLNRTEATLPLASEVERGPAKGFHAGAFVTLRFSPLVDLQIEALYTEKGLAGTRANRKLSYELEGSYVEIPVLAKIRMPWARSGPVVPYASVGPSVAFEVSCRLRGKDGDTYLNYLCDGPPVHFDQRKKFDYGLMLGAGVEIPMAVGRLTVDLAYDWSIRDLADSPDIPGAVRHGAFMASAGFATALGR